jgi:hypothetical protein
LPSRYVTNLHGVRESGYLPAWNEVTRAYGLDPLEEAAMTATYDPEDKREDVVPSPEEGTEEAPPGSAGARATPDDAQPPPTTV